MANSYPEFVTSLKTTWQLPVVTNGSVTTYKLPELVDKQGNDEPEVYIEWTEGEAHPPFMSYNNAT